jgi:hypothetical protein
VPSHKVRSIIAAATLAAGVTWLTATPADATTRATPAHATFTQATTGSAAIGYAATGHTATGSAATAHVSPRHETATWLTTTLARAVANRSAAAPARAAACEQKQATVAGDLTLSCGDHPTLRLDNVSPAGRPVTPEVVGLAMAAGRLARELGLTGLATPSAAPGLIDLGGIVATWGMPPLAAATAPQSLPMAAGATAMEDLATEAHVPELPRLPITGAPTRDRDPKKTTTSRDPLHNGRAAKNDARNDIKNNGRNDDEDDDHGYDRDRAKPATKGLEGPMQEVGSKLISELLPKAMQGLGGTSILPGGDSGAAGLAGLVKGFG